MPFSALAPLAIIASTYSPVTPAADVASAPIGTHTSARENFRTFNYGNIKATTAPTTWMEYGSPANGVAAVADWLRRSQRDHGTYTLAQMIERYSPAYDNPGKNLIGEAAKRTGFKPDQRLDMENVDQLHKIAAAILAQEGASRRVLDAAAATKTGVGLPPNSNPPAESKKTTPDAAAQPRYIWQSTAGSLTEVRPHQWYGATATISPPKPPEEISNE